MAFVNKKLHDIKIVPIKALFSISLCLAILAPASAQPQDEIQVVVDFTNKYIDTNACEPGLAAESSVTKFSPIKSSGSSGLVRKRYAVLWSGDEGCTGGSGKNLPHISIVDIDKIGAPSFHLPENSEISALQNIETIISATEDSIVVRGTTWGDGDGECCATNYGEATLTRNRRGFLTIKKFRHLGQKNN